MALDLKIIISAVEQIDAAFRKTEAGLDGLASKAGVVGGAMTAAGAAIIGAFAVSSNAIAEQGEELLKASKQSGVAIERLSALRYVAEQNEVAFEGLNTGLRFLQRNAAQAAQGVGPAAAVFSELGISVRDASGEIKEGDALLLEVADALRRTESDADRTRIAMALLGRGGAQSLPLLTMGAEQIAAAMQEAHERGLVWSEAQAQAADEWGDSLAALKLSLGAFVREAVVPTMEALQPIADSMGRIIGETARWVGEHETAAKVIGTAAITIGAALGVGGPILMALGPLMNGIRIVSGWFGGMGIAATEAGTASVVASERAALALNAETAAAERAAAAYVSKGAAAAGGGAAGAGGIGAGAAAGAAGIPAGAAVGAGVAIGAGILGTLKIGQLALRQRDYRRDLEAAKTPEERATRNWQEMRWLLNDPAGSFLIGGRRRERLREAMEVESQVAFGRSSAEVEALLAQWEQEEREGRIRTAVNERRQKAGLPTPPPSPKRPGGGMLPLWTPEVGAVKDRLLQPVLGERGDLSGVRAKGPATEGAGGRQRVDVNVRVTGSPEMMRELLRSPEGRRAFEDQLRETGLRAAYAP